MADAIETGLRDAVNKMQHYVDVYMPSTIEEHDHDRLS